MPFMRFKDGGRHVYKPGCRHCQCIDAYSAARANWESLRESSMPAWGAAGAAHSGCALYQLSDEEFAALYPPPLFGDFLKAFRKEEPPGSTIDFSD